MAKDKPKRNVVISFRTDENFKQKLDREAKRRKLTRQAFIESLFMPAFETATAKQAA